ncbi:MAG TPA: 1-(5-phosphoribosyl)-5-[(5-phosphoribosylamino)methylideneamino]imidazole-4-carboxamide isomerase [Candidatus Gordonibacter avicola]|nr:1-(5-phosphoribosyl)-5-[(5-phosphoribosylamino)methylideneamino]imidazole-4-carboxamide isomerase [Candidatus Gordonibacter avicola]
MYLLPAIDILGGKAVRLAKGDYNQVTVYNDDPAAQAQLFEDEGATWLHVVDLDGARSGEPENIAIIEHILAKTKLKVEVGGGIRSLDTIARLADAGVSRVVLGTSLVADPAFAEAAVAQYGQLLTAGIDAKGGEVAVAGWREGVGVAAEELARHVSELGFCHLVYTDIARDGMQTGIDPTAYVRMAEAFGHPVIASGGVAGVADIERLGQVAASIEGVIAGRAIYEGSLSVKEGVDACEEATRRAEAGVAASADWPSPAPITPC